MSKYNFYLSYCCSDGKRIAEQLCAKLKERGYSVFFDKESLSAGDSYMQSIMEAIASSDYFLPIITKGASKSLSAMRELSLAISKAESRATKILPINASGPLEGELKYYLACIQQIPLDPSGDLPSEIERITEKIDQLVGHELKASLLYEKLSAYKKLLNQNKKAETLCALIGLTKEKLQSTLAHGSSDLWESCESLLDLYEQLSGYIGSYDEDSRRIAHLILKELDGIRALLNGSSNEPLPNPFTHRLLFASVAIRLIFMDRNIRSECADILTNGDVQNPCPIDQFIKIQKPFIEAYRREYKNIEQESKKEFIEKSAESIFSGTLQKPIERILEQDIYNALQKCGYQVETEIRSGRFTIDLAIKKNGRYILYIECCSKAPSNTENLYQTALKEYIASIGGTLHTIYNQDWSKDPQGELQKIKEILDRSITEDDELFLSIAKFIQDGNKLFDVLQEKGMAGDFLECLRESYERLKNYCIVVGADDVAAECAERIVELRNEAEKQQNQTEENEKAEKGIKSLLGYTLENSGKYDVFISFKSEDSDLAEKIYNYCHRKMKEPFWSKKSLPRLSQSEYSQAIDMALENSKHFVVVFSDLGYLNTKWIKYEMNVFNNEIKEGRKEGSNFIIVATDDVYDKIIQSNKTVLDIAYRRFQIIKMSEYEETLSQYIS